jgi:RNA polymerase sigma-70 factor (ECF subfamily)
MNMDPAIRDAMIAAIPRLRKFAVSLAGAQQADDLVQETLLQACSKIRLFNPTSPMLPWLITILRNQFYSQYRKRRREVEDVDGAYAEALVVEPSQVTHAEHQDVRTALSKLPIEMREALIAIGWRGLSYQEAARACDCPIGTLRSRVHRARESLAALLDLDGPVIGAYEWSGINGLGSRAL